MLWKQTFLGVSGSSCSLFFPPKKNTRRSRNTPKNYSLQHQPFRMVYFAKHLVKRSLRQRVWVKPSRAGHFVEREFSGRLLSFSPASPSFIHICDCPGPAECMGLVKLSFPEICSKDLDSFLIHRGEHATCFLPTEAFPCILKVEPESCGGDCNRAEGGGGFHNPALHE